MSVSLPSLDSALDSLPDSFDPSAILSAATSGLSAQQAAAEATRSALATTRAELQKATANADFEALSSYTSGMQANLDLACVVSSTKPALTAMTPDTLSNPLSSDLLDTAIGLTTGDLSSALSGSGTAGLTDVLGDVDTDLLIEAASLATGTDIGSLAEDVSNLPSAEAITSLAITGAGVYVSSLTGGVVSPEICSAVIETVAGDAINSVVSTALSDPTAVLSATSAINTDISASGLTSVISTDLTGQLLESTVSSATGGLLDSLPDSTFSSLTSTDITNLGTTLASELGCDADGFTESLGGISLTDSTSIENSLLLAGIEKAADMGDITQVSMYTELLDASDIPNSLYQSYIDEAATNMLQTSNNINQYVELYNTTNNLVSDVTDTTSVMATAMSFSMYTEYILQDSTNIKERSRLSSFWSNHATAALTINSTGTVAISGENITEYGYSLISVTPGTVIWDDVYSMYTSTDEPEYLLLYNSTRDDCRYVKLTTTNGLTHNYIYNLAVQLVELDVQDSVTASNTNLLTSIPAQIGGTIAELILGQETARKIATQQSFIAANYA